MSIVAIVIIVIVVILAIALVGLYNNFVKLRNRVDNAWSQIDVQLQRLVETVKGYAAHESGTLESVTAARTACMNATTPEQRAEAENVLTGTLKTLFAVSENYPDLKANQNFLELQGELRDTEDKISYMRQSYNDTVMTFNNAIQTFPGVLIAGPFGFKARELFDAAESAAAAPSVKF